MWHAIACLGIIIRCIHAADILTSWVDSRDIIINHSHRVMFTFSLLADAPLSLVTESRRLEFPLTRGTIHLLEGAVRLKCDGGIQIESISMGHRFPQLVPVLISDSACNGVDPQIANRLLQYTLTTTDHRLISALERIADEGVEGAERSIRCAIEILSTEKQIGDRDVVIQDDAEEILIGLADFIAPSDKASSASHHEHRWNCKDMITQALAANAFKHTRGHHQEGSSRHGTMIEHEVPASEIRQHVSVMYTMATEAIDMLKGSSFLEMHERSTVPHTSTEHVSLDDETERSGYNIDTNMFAEVTAAKYPLADMLSEEQEMTLALVEVVDHMHSLSESGIGLKTGTIYEVLIRPCINIMNALMPKIIYLLLREPFAEILVQLLTRMLKKPLTAPALDNMDPLGGSSGSGGSGSVRRRRRRRRRRRNGSDGSDGDGDEEEEGEEGVTFKSSIPGTPSGPCLTDPECLSAGSGYRCILNQCELGNKEGEACPPECAAGMECVESVCKPLGNVNDPCPKPTHCMPHLECSNMGKCVLPGGYGAVCPPPCITGLLCVSGTCIPPSLGPPRVRCEAGCAEGEACVNGLCKAVGGPEFVVDIAAGERYGDTDVGETAIGYAAKLEEEAAGMSHEEMKSKATEVLLNSVNDTRHMDGELFGRNPVSTTCETGPACEELKLTRVQKLAPSNGTLTEEEEAARPTRLGDSRNATLIASGGVSLLLSNETTDGDSLPGDEVAFVETRASIPGSVEAGGDGLMTALIEAVTAAVCDKLTQSVSTLMGRELNEKITSVVSRSATRSLSLKLTDQLSEALSRQLQELLSLSLTAIPTEELTKMLVPSLTHSIAPIITKALTRNPQDDFYCHYCKEFAHYCDECDTSKEKDADQDVASTQFAGFYSQYYTHYYGDYIAKAIVDDFRSHRMSEGKTYVDASK